MTEAKSDEPNLLFRAFPSLVLLVQSGVATDEEWDAWVATVASSEKAGVRKMLVIVEDGSVTGKQRRQLNALGLPPDYRTVIVTDSSVARVVVSIISWVHKQMFTFSPAQLDEAFTCLEIPVADRPAILDEIASLRAKLLGGPNADPADYRIVVR